MAVAGDKPMVKKFSWRLLRTTKAALAGLALLVSFPITNGSAQKVAVLGYLTNANADPKRIEDVRHALANLGYVEGKNIAIEVKGAKSNSDYAPLAAELVARPVDIIIGVNAAATSAARNATRTIPIVMTAVNDPVEWGFINSLERPGTNVTGTTLNAPHLLGERLRILKGLVPALDRISMLVNGSNAANGPQFSLLNAEAKALNIEALALDVRLPQDIAPAFDKALAFGAKALVHTNDSFINSQRALIAKLAAQNGLAAIYVDREYVVAGGLMSFGPGHRQGDIAAAKYVDAILRGANPGELRVEVPTEFTFSVSRSALDKLGLTLPNEVKSRVNEWLE
jgi:putative ABC transport system substrate-binding protein